MRITNSILWFLISIVTPQVIYGYDFSSDNFNFNFIGSSDNVVLCSPIETTSDINIPASISFRGRNFNVVIIADNAFRGRSIQSVVIPEGITEIGHNAFRNTNIQQIIMPNSLQRIGEYAFANCENLKYIEFGTNIISSRYSRTLRYTFADDDNIEKIVFRGTRPPLNFNDYPAFSNVTKQFAQVLVPLNGYFNFLASPWKYTFAKPIIPYIPEGTTPEIVPYAMYFWDDSKVSSTHHVKGLRYEYKDNVPVEIPAELVIEKMQDKHGAYIVKITFYANVGNKDFRVPAQTFYSYWGADDKPNNIKAYYWTIIDADEDPRERSISIDFYEGKFPIPKKILGGYIKDSYKKIDTKIMKVVINAEGNLVDYQGEFRITEISNDAITIKSNDK